jgi:uncharacterized protein YecT (DUF1311 family)
MVWEYPMKKGVLCLLGVVSLVNVGHALADDDCDVPGNSPFDVEAAQCEDRRYREADVALNAAYKDRIRAPGENRQMRQALILSERQWIVQRDRTCKKLTLEVIGLTYAVLNGRCLADQTNERLKALQSGQN